MKNILFVEDDDNTRLMYCLTKRYLPEGYSIYTVTTGEQAFRDIQDTTYDIIITDMNLGEGISGKQLFLLIKEKHESNSDFEMPIFIFCSGTEELVKEAIKETQGYRCSSLIKPFDLKELADAILSFEG